MSGRSRGCAATPATVRLDAAVRHHRLSDIGRFISSLAKMTSTRRRDVGSYTATEPCIDALFVPYGGNDVPFELDRCFVVSYWQYQWNWYHHNHGNYPAPSN